MPQLAPDTKPWRVFVSTFWTALTFIDALAVVLLLFFLFTVRRAWHAVERQVPGMRTFRPLCLILVTAVVVAVVTWAANEFRIAAAHTD